jgi:hypothetical protein
MTDALHIVLLGMPDAGKTSLLAALAEAARTQTESLAGRLTAPEPKLEELRQGLYEGKPQSAQETLASYPLRFEQTAADDPTSNESLDAVVVDSAGPELADLLLKPRVILTGSKKSNLGQAVSRADAVILAVDAAAGPALERSFAELARFLETLEETRGQRTEVGGLPVYLILTKCDLLAVPGDTPESWMERIEERKREVQRRFASFLERHSRHRSARFGSLDLHLWATAVKRPAFKESGSKTNEPYGVAELFRQALGSARAFQERRGTAGRRLAWTLAGSILLVAFMCLTIAGLVGRTRQADPEVRVLQSALDSYRSREAQTASLRLREPIQAKIGELTDIRSSPAFDRIPEDQRQYLLSRLQELQDYKAYKEKIVRLPAPESVRNEQELGELEASLTSALPPAEYRSHWEQTEAMLLRAQRLDECKALRGAVADLQEWYNSLSRRGRDLWSFSRHGDTSPVTWPDWQSQVLALLNESESRAQRRGERLPGSNRLTYAALQRFETVATARTNWDGVRQRLLRVRDLSMALGLAGSQPGRSPLDIHAGFSLPEAVGRLEQLQKNYPRFREEFVLADLPEAITDAVRQAAQARYAKILNVGRAVVLGHLVDLSPSNEETPESWKRLLPWLAKPDDLESWRVLANILARLANREAADPVADLERFLRADRFDVIVRRVALELPDDQQLRPAGPLTIRFQKTPMTEAVTYSLDLQPDERRDATRRVTRFSFQPSDPIAFTYSPGDTLWIQLPVKKADQPGWVLTWTNSRSKVYQIERYALAPRLHRSEQENTQGDPVDGVLAISPESGVPPVPDLLPAVPPKLDRR